MAPRNTRTIGPKKGGGWEVTGRAVTPKPVKTQAAGVVEARRQLNATGGGRSEGASVPLVDAAVYGADLNTASEFYFTAGHR